jgi:hypothetical protein
MREVRNAYRTFVGKSEEKNHLEDLDVDGRTILEWILNKYVGGYGLDLPGSLQETEINKSKRARKLLFMKYQTSISIFFIYLLQFFCFRFYMTDALYFYLLFN